MYARASTCGAVGMDIGAVVGAGVSARQGTVANAVRNTQARHERSINEYLGRI